VPAPHLVIDSPALPSHISAADNGLCELEGANEQPPCDGYQVTVSNIGSRTAAGPVVLVDRLPAGLSIIKVSLFLARNPTEPVKASDEDETSSGVPLDSGTLCKTERAPVTVSCELPPEKGELKPDYRLEMRVYVHVEETAADALNKAEVSEAGTVVASSEADDVISPLAAPFGASAFLSYITGVDGAADTQAGDHPYEFATRIDMNTKLALNTEATFVEPVSVQQLRDVVVDLPLGFVGSATSTAKCTFGQLQAYPESCPADTMVGHIATEPQGMVSTNIPIYNMVPEKGHVAEFGFADAIYHTHALYASIVPTQAGYALRILGREIPQIPLTNIIMSLYGNPAEKNEGGATPEAQFTNPSDCNGEPLRTRLYMDSWEDPAALSHNGTPLDLTEPAWKEMTSESPAVSGCNELRFDPAAFTFAPEAAHSQADEPAGYELTLKVPQTETPGTLGTPPLKTATVTLPPGVAISPATADGLVGCQETGSEGINLSSTAPGTCPDASKVGTAEVLTPLIEEHLQGSLYLAQPACGGSGQAECTEEAAEMGGIFALYLEVGSESSGVHLKLKGKIEVGGYGRHSREVGLAPGQVRTTFAEMPQLPFGELKLKFKGGPRAPLANPQGCGTFTTYASLEPWSAPESGPDAVEQPSFDITGCASPMGFAPSFTAGTISSRAGAYSPLTLTFSRQDGEQGLGGMSVTLPPGLLARIAGVPECPEAQANAGTCGVGSPGSRIGTATAAAGAGSEPLWQSGSVYLTGPYNGGPFGLSVVVSANAGPFNLGNIVIRAAIYINPGTGQLTVVSGVGGDSIPQSIDGIPLRLQTVNLTIDREGFIFNPTGCSQAAVNGTITSAQGVTVPTSSHFEAVNCASLKFKPVFSATTQARTSNAKGASLTVKLSYPNLPQGAQADIKSVKVDLPKQLPSRLTTLQQACLAAQFDANPASCPAASVIGTARAVTPVLSVPLEGPAYFVSHGSETFPSLIIVLQGDGVTIQLTGTTFINSKGVTSVTFKQVPDAPISSFELKLPEGPFSALGTNKDLCRQKLAMPTALTGQNGAVIHQSTSVGVVGCAKARAKAGKKRR